MSTETPATPSTVRAEARERAGRRRFRRATIATIVVLAIAATALGAAGVLRGPGLAAAAFDPDAAVARSGVELVIDLDQAVEELEAGDVTVTPATAVTAEADVTRVTVRFDEVLRYAEGYTVQLALASRATAASSVIEYRFSTPDVDVFSLDRGGDDGTDDRVLRHRLSEAVSNEVVVTAPRIQEYAVAGDLVATIELDADDAPSLTVTSMIGNGSAPVALPEARALRGLAASPTAGLFGVMVDAVDDAQSGLYVHDPQDPSGSAVAVADADGVLIAAMDWLFVPGRSALVVQGRDEQLFLVDPLSGEPATPIGQHLEMREFLPGTTQLAVADPTAASLLDLTAGTTTQLDLPLPEVDDALYPGAFVLTSAESYIEQFGNPIGLADTTHRSILYTVDAEGTRELYTPPVPSSRIGEVCLSPNGQYLAVEVIPDGARPDLYPVVQGWSEVSVYFVDAVTGASTRGVTGMSSDWCV